MTKLILIFLLFNIFNIVAQNRKIQKTTVMSKNNKKLNWAQKHSLKQLYQFEKDSIPKHKKTEKKKIRIANRESRRLKNIRPYDALAPSKATFYSAILPGLGQIYTGKYWKTPIVYAALGTSIGIAFWNNNTLKEIQNEYQDRLRGKINPESNLAKFSNEGLVDRQQHFRKQKELSILVSIGIYVLNIIDANVTSHLQQYNLNENLTLTPKIDVNNIENISNLNYGLTLKYNL